MNTSVKIIIGIGFLCIGGVAAWYAGFDPPWSARQDMTEADSADTEQCRAFHTRLLFDNTDEAARTGVKRCDAAQAQREDANLP